MKFFDTLLLIILTAAAGTFLFMFSAQSSSDEATECLAPSAAVGEPSLQINTAVEQPPEYARAATLNLDSDGHFYANAIVNDNTARFLVDTGASSVALTYFDAQRLGLAPDTLDYTIKVSTAGGETQAAYVRLNRIRIGNVEVQNVDALVLREDLKNSLLGMSFLGELYSYEFRRRHLILRQ